MKNWKPWIILTVVFLLGVSTGVVGTGMFLKYKFGPPRKPGEFHKQMKRRVMDRLTDKLDLTDKQIPAVRIVVNDTLNKMHKLRMETDPKLRGIISNGISETKKLLTAEQSAKLDRYIKKYKERRWFKAFRPPPFLRPPPPPHGD